MGNNSAPTIDSGVEALESILVRRGFLSHPWIIADLYSRTGNTFMLHRQTADLTNLDFII